MNIIFPMIGANTYDGGKHFYPKPLIEVRGRTMFEGALSPFLAIPNAHFVAAVNEKDAHEYSLKLVLERALEGCSSQVMTLPGETGGALITTLLSASSVELSESLIVSNYDHDLRFDLGAVIKYFENEKCDFGVVSFKSIHPKWAYASADESGSIIEVAAKKPISDNALVGLFYFKLTSDFVDAAEQAILAAPADQEIFYVPEALNQMILAGKRGRIYRIDESLHTNFYDEGELDNFLNNSTKGEHISEPIAKYLAALGANDLIGLCECLSHDVMLVASDGHEIVGRNDVAARLLSEFEAVHRGNSLFDRVSCSESLASIHFTREEARKISIGVKVLQFFNNKVTKVQVLTDTI